MPDKEISVKEGRSVRKWMREKGGVEIANFRDRIIGSGVYSVDGEPLVMIGTTDFNEWDEEGLTATGYRLLCTDKQAGKFEKDGVIRFSEPQQGVKTP